MKTIAFDIYGTLVDTHGTTALLESMVGDKAKVFSGLWRTKQLEYTFRRGLMRDYKDFSVCVKDALEYTCMHLNAPLSQEQKETLIKAYQTLPAFDDAEECLKQLKQEGYKLFALSNGSASAVKKLLQHSKLTEHFTDIISVEEIKTFKPNPDIYTHFMKRAKADPQNTWLVSANPFDIIGAMHTGMRAAWIRRTKDNIFDPWGITPTATVASLLELRDML